MGGGENFTESGLYLLFYGNEPSRILRLNTICRHGCFVCVHRLSSRVLCATLAIPIPASRSRIDALMQMDETTLEKKKRLSNLLSLKEPPTRVGLIKDLVSVTSRTLLYLSSLP